MAVATGGCVTYPADPVQDSAPARSFVGLGQPVSLGGGYVATPRKVYEDSRCHVGVQCVWAGRVVVTTQIDGPGWSETLNLVSGKPLRTHGHEFLLIEVLPAQHPQEDISESDYRFNFVMD
ncbi:hypothetical protein AB433_07870 [Croceicoccus naphthovorans]|uniref:Uncharacterized protein n=2 Tax=Croceicoccus naphthovorans TaxID=1348774 RepID=A0A0G3XFD0_9SPHN|nr:hypothetical protein AB433_07870 [Croceicoccus naphthovorans]